MCNQVELAAKLRNKILLKFLWFSFEDAGLWEPKHLGVIMQHFQKKLYSVFGATALPPRNYSPSHILEEYSPRIGMGSSCAATTHPLRLHWLKLALTIFSQCDIDTRLVSKQGGSRFALNYQSGKKISWISFRIVN